MSSTFLTVPAYYNTLQNLNLPKRKKEKKKRLKYLKIYNNQKFINQIKEKNFTPVK